MRCHHSSLMVLLGTTIIVSYKLLAEEDALAMLDIMKLKHKSTGRNHCIL